MREKYFKDGHAGHVLALGCGEGFIERLFKERGFKFDSITGIDLGDKCIEAALQRAKEVNLAPEINYIAADLNNYELPKKEYDFIFFFHSLHHVNNLEKLLSNCAKVLHPKGVVMLNEFVGPSRFQWTEKQLKIANELFTMLPEDLRFDLQYKNTKNEIKPMTIEEMVFHDASEAVRSEEIEGLFKANFNVTEEKNWGGTFMNLIFSNTAGNYDPENEYHATIINLLVHYENTLIENNVLPSDFKFYMAESKK